MATPVFALIFPLGDTGLTPGYPLPTPPVYPGQGLPGAPVHPSHPIVIPPDAVAPGLPTLPIVLPDPPVDPGYGHPGWSPVDPGYGHGGGLRPDQGLPGSGGHPWLPGHRPDRPTHPIVYPPGIPSQGLPPTPGLPPLVPANPIAGLPDIGTLPVLPPHLGGGHPSHGLPGGGWGSTQPIGPGAGSGVLPQGSVVLVPLPSDKPMPMPPGVPEGSKPYLAWGGRGTLPLVCWVEPQAAPKGGAQD